jgi:tetratricopeptide (TPR) repeat protein
METVLQAGVAVLVLGVVVPVLASPEVEAGKAAFLKGEFRAAIAKLDEAERSPATTEEALVDVFWYRGAAFHALGKASEAAASFDRLLAVRPLYAPNKLESPPDVRAVFKERQEAFQRSHPVNLGTPVLLGADIVVTVQATNADVTVVTVFVRPAGEVPYKAVDLPVSGGTGRGPLADVGLWGRAAKAGRMDYVVEARSARGTPLARVGDARTPLSMAVTNDQRDAAVSALKAVAPPPMAVSPAQAGAQPPATDPAPSAGGVAPAASREEGPSPASVALLVAGGGVVAVGGVVFLASVLAVLGAVASVAAYGGAAYWFGNVPGTEVSPLYGPAYAAYMAGLWVGAGLLALGGVLGLGAVTTGGLGLVLLAVRQVLP